jgi:hypothetical protein
MSANPAAPRIGPEVGFQVAHRSTGSISSSISSSISISSSCHRCRRSCRRSCRPHRLEPEPAPPPSFAVCPNAFLIVEKGPSSATAPNTPHLMRAHAVWLRLTYSLAWTCCRQVRWHRRRRRQSTPPARLCRRGDLRCPRGQLRSIACPAHRRRRRRPAWRGRRSSILRVTARVSAKCDNGRLLRSCRPRLTPARWLAACDLMYCSASGRQHFDAALTPCHRRDAAHSIADGAAGRQAGARVAEAVLGGKQ